MLKRLIRSIRQKPKVVRDNVALGAAGFFTAAVCAVWLYHMPSKMESIASEQGKGEETPGFSDLFGKIGDQFATVKEAVSTVSDSEDKTKVSTEAAEAEVVATSSVAAETATTTPVASSSSTSVVTGSSTVSAEESTDAPRPIRIITTSTATSTSVASTTESQ